MRTCLSSAPQCPWKSQAWQHEPTSPTSEGVDRRILRSYWSASLATVMTLGRVWETLPQIIKCREKEEDTGCQPLASTCAHMCKHTHSPHTLMHTHIKNRQKSAMVKTIQYWLPNGELTGKRLEGTFWNCGTVHQLNVWLTRLCILL